MKAVFSKTFHSYNHFDLMNEELFDSSILNSMGDSTKETDFFDLEHLLKPTYNPPPPFENNNIYGQAVGSSSVYKSSSEESFTYLGPLDNTILNYNKYRVSKPSSKKNKRKYSGVKRLLPDYSSIKFDEISPEEWSVEPFSPLEVAESVKCSLNSEFRLLSYYKDMHSRNRTLPPNPRKRRESSDLIWKPLSVFKVYTTITPREVDDTNYYDNIPFKSCFGQINMRIKGAWKRTR